MFTLILDGIIDLAADGMRHALDDSLLMWREESAKHNLSTCEVISGALTAACLLTTGLKTAAGSLDLAMLVLLPLLDFLGALPVFLGA